MSWEEVRQLRQEKKYAEAWALGQSLLEADPRDFRTRSQLEWVCHGRMKSLVGTIKADLKAGSRPEPAHLRQVDAVLNDFSSLPRVEVPGMACSVILQALAAIAPHVSQFGAFVRWVRDDGLRAEDWKPNNFNGKTYASIATLVARGLAKWVRAHAPEDSDFVADAVRWLRLAREHAGPHSEWIDWDLALMLRLQGDHEAAARCLSTVLKSKRNEFWAWAEAGRLYAKEQPELARACFCRALSCPAEEGFTVNVHVDLAALLAELEEFPQASRETAVAIGIRERLGWKIPAELQGLIDSNWYDPDAPGAVEPKEFYVQYASEALVLCFDEVETVSGSYLGTIIPQPESPPLGWKPRPLPRFAAQDRTGMAWSVVGPGMKVRHLSPGTSVTLVRGLQDGRETIVQVVPRVDGTPWDCLNIKHGLAWGSSEKDGALRAFLDRDHPSIKIHASAAGANQHFKPGEPLLLRVVTNPKRKQFEVAAVERAELRDHPDIQPFSGRLQRHARGFAFVDDIFIAPLLLQSLPVDADSATGLAVYGRKPKSEDYGWSAATIQST